MKILQINSFYNEGSTGKILYDNQEILNSLGYEMRAAYGRGKIVITGEKRVFKFCNEVEVKIHNLFVVLGLSLQYGGSPLGTYRLIRYIQREKPDVVHLHCINMSCVNIYSVLKYLASKKIPTVVTHHAEFYYTGACGHSFECNRWFENQCRGCKKVRYATQSRTISRTHESWVRMYKAFSKFSYDKLIFAAVSPWVKERSSLSPIVNKYRCAVVKNGLDTKVFSYNPKQDVFKTRFPNINGRIVLHPSASFWPDNPDHNKGGWFVVELAKRLPNVTFVVVSLKTSYNMKLPSNLIIWGAAKDQIELSMLYSSADLTLLTSKKETFSMVCAESLCCGTPIVGFKAGGPESISLPEYSTFVEYCDIDSLYNALKTMLNIKFDKYVISNYAKTIYSKEVMSQEYLEVYRSVL